MSPTSRGPRRWTSLLAILFITLLASALSGQVRKSARASDSSVRALSDWTPERTSFRRGEPARFRATWQVYEPGAPLLHIDAFESVETGELYPAALVGRLADAKPGPRSAVEVRMLPPRMKPGRYRLRGWVRGEGRLRSMPAIYQSKVFSVTE